MEQKVVLSREEYEELLSWKETAEILSDKETMDPIKQSLKEIERGEFYKVSDL